MISAWRIRTLTNQMYQATVRAAARDEDGATAADALESVQHLVVRLERLGYTITRPARAA
jgi:hypothetical protein